MSVVEKIKEIKKVLNEFPEPYIGGIGWCTFRIEEMKQFKTKLHGILALLQDHEQKLRGFGELLKTRPETMDYPYARKPWCNPEKSAECFELLEKKFRELKEK